MIPKNKIEEAAKSFGSLVGAGSGIIECANCAYDGFLEGVTFVEKELENLAIEFAISLLSKSVIKRYSVDKCEEYTPKEFDLLKGELLLNGKELFETFKKEKYGTESN